MTGVGGPDGEDRRARWDARHATHDPIETIEEDLALGDEAAGLTPGRALDLGTGDGRNAVWLAQRGWQVTAVDFSSVALDRARTRSDAEGVAAHIREPRVDWTLSKEYAGDRHDDADTYRPSEFEPLGRD